MAINITQLVQKRKNVAIALDEGTLNVAFNPAKYNAKTEAEFQDAISSNRPVSSLATLLSRLLISWDLKESDAADAESLPVTADTLEMLGVDTLGEIVKGVMDAMKVGEK